MRRKRFWLQISAVVGVAVLGGGIIFIDSAHGPRPQLVSMDDRDESKTKPEVQAPSGVQASSEMDLASVRKAVTAAHGVLNQSGVCSSFEYFATGLPVPRPSSEEWSKVMGLYHSAKVGLLSWTKANQERIPASTLQKMETVVNEVRIHRPPAVGEPDIGVRGVGVLSQDLQGRPMIQVGGGFMRLARENPTRAQFELARLVAQTWAPCALEGAKVESPWSPLLKCVGVDSSAKCEGSAFSEAGWAVSSVVAAKVAPPGCEIPALVSADRGACMTDIPLPLVAQNSVQSAPQSVSQPASRRPASHEVREAR